MSYAWTTEDSRELFLCSERQVKDLQEEDWAREVRLQRLNQDQLDLFNISSDGELLVQVSDYITPSKPVSLHKILAETEDSVAMIRFPELIERQMNRLNLAFATSIFWESAPETDLPQGLLKFQGIYPVKVNQRREVIETIIAYDTNSRFPIGLDAAKKSPVGRHKELMHIATLPGSGLVNVSPIWSLEAGSRPELVIALAYMDKQRELMQRQTGVWEQEHMVVLNGPKDPIFLHMALQAMKRKMNVIVVVDSPHELPEILKEARKIWPDGDFGDLRLGVRIKTLTPGSGAWEESGGKCSKFGLTTVELYHFFNSLIDLNLTGCLKLLHYHIGSQVVEWESITDSTVEMMRLYLELRDKGFKNLRRLDIGGGLAFNYDQHLIKDQSSALYDHEDYADMVVRVIAKVLRNHVRNPTRYGDYGPIIVSSESGRFLTASYSVLAAQVLENRYHSYPSPPDFQSESMRSLHEAWKANFPIEPFTFDHQDLPSAREPGTEISPESQVERRKEPQKVLDSVLWNLHRLLHHFGLFAPAEFSGKGGDENWKPYTREFFDLSYVEILAYAIEDVEKYMCRIGKHSLRNMAEYLEYEFLMGALDRLITTTFRYFCEQQLDIVGPKGFPAHPFTPSRRYIVNFSTFGQLIDTQLVQQYFPIIPLSHLDKKPDYMASIGDMTCDSDGEIKKFVSFVDRNWGNKPGDISQKEAITKCFTMKDHKVMAIPGERLDLRGVPVHDFNPSSEKYYMAWLFVGAYQDVLRTRHNLLGKTNSILVSTRRIPWLAMDPTMFGEHEFFLWQQPGETVEHVIEEMDYNCVEIKRRLERLFDKESLFVEWMLHRLPYHTDFP